MEIARCKLRDRTIRAPDADVDLVEQHVIEDQDPSMDLRIAIEQANVEPVRAVDEAERGIAMRQGLEKIRVDVPELLVGCCGKAAVDRITRARREHDYGAARAQHDRFDRSRAGRQRKQHERNTRQSR